MSLPSDPSTAGQPPQREPDAHGQAALLLVESLLHALVEARALSDRQALAAVESAIEVKREVAAHSGESVERMQASIDLLGLIANSLRADGR